MTLPEPLPKAAVHSSSLFQASQEPDRVFHSHANVYDNQPGEYAWVVIMAHAKTLFTTSKQAVVAQSS
jgi:hypothetical protein